jgi:hypothetical protein
MRDQARKKATAGVKSRLDGRYYAVRSIRSTQPAGRELNATGGRNSRTMWELVSKVRTRGGSGTITSTTLRGR